MFAQIKRGIIMFYERLKQSCKKSGTTITAILREMNMNSANTSSWKNGGKPSTDVLVKLSERLNVSTDYLLTGKEKEPSLDEQLEGVDFALWGEVKELTDGEKKDILDFIKFKKAQRGD